MTVQKLLEALTSAIEHYPESAEFIVWVNSDSSIICHININDVTINLEKENVTIWV
jgi:hypothetical protein